MIAKILDKVIPLMMFIFSALFWYFLVNQIISEICYNL